MAKIVDSMLPPVGSFRAYSGLTAPVGWLLCDASTIGNTGSGSTRTGADYRELYEHLWNNIGTSALSIFTSAGAPTTKGGSASADWAALKRIGLPDVRGRVIAGKDDMGGTPAGLLTGWRQGVNGTIQGNKGGEEYHVQALDELRQHNHTGTTNSSTVGNISSGGAGFGIENTNDASSPFGGHAHSFTTNNTGSSVGANVVQPTYISTYIIKF